MIINEILFPETGMPLCPKESKMLQKQKTLYQTKILYLPQQAGVSRAAI